MRHQLTCSAYWGMESDCTCRPAPKAGDIVERTGEPGVACIVTAVHGGIVEFTILQGPDKGRERMTGERVIRVLVPAPETPK